MRYLTAGESHGPRLTAIIEGIPAGLPLTAEDINVDLKRRQGGYGRGGRMKIESDKVEITSGVRHGKTTGAPITLHVINKDHEKWLDIMAVEDIDDSLKTKRKITHPRPGHADLVGGMKYRFEDLRNSLERSSARETTMRVAVGAVAKRILAELDIEIANHVVVFGGKEIDVPEGLTVSQIKELASQSEVSIVNQEREQEIKDYIDQIKKMVILLAVLLKLLLVAFQLVLVLMFNGTRNLMQKLQVRSFQSVLSRELNLVWDLKMVTSKEAKSWMKFFGPKKMATLVVPIILVVLKVV